MAFWVETLNSLSTEPSSTCQLQQRDTVACSWARCCYSDMIAWSTALSTSMYGAEGSLEPHDVTMLWMQPTWSFERVKICLSCRCWKGLLAYRYGIRYWCDSSLRWRSPLRAILRNLRLESQIMPLRGDNGAFHAIQRP